MTTAPPSTPPTVVHNLRVISGSTPTATADVLFKDGRLHILPAAGSAPSGAKSVDGRGLLLLPGFYDLRTRLREPGREADETIATGTAAAINGGFTGLLMTPDTTPSIDNGGMVQSLRDLVSKHSPIPVNIAGCLTQRHEGTHLAELGEMHSRGAVLFNDDPASPANALLMRRALQYARSLGLLVASLPDVPELSAGGAMHEGPYSYRLGLRGIHPCAEEIGLARDLRLAQSTGARLHIRHVTTARAVDTIRRYKLELPGITAEVAPHHLLYSDADIGDYDTRYKVSPPLRSTEDVDALREAVRDGTIDIIATDHSPLTETAKSRDFASAPAGMSWLDTALLAVHHHLILPGHLTWEVLTERMAYAPRRLIGQPLPQLTDAASLDAILFDPHATTTITPDFLRSRSHNTPLLGQTLTGSVAAVLLDSAVLLDRRGIFS